MRRTLGFLLIFGMLYFVIAHSYFVVRTSVAIAGIAVIAVILFFYSSIRVSGRKSK